MLDERLLRQEEKAIYVLRALYHSYGYMPYKMGKFEEYELYLRNKDFLVSDQVITFNDTNGRLMALKPDVTLSIIKSGEDHPGYKQKVYYDENVYRVSQNTHRYKEIMQSGIECIGDIDLYDMYEVITLAAESLASIRDSFVLEISHLGLISQELELACSDKEFKQGALHCISAKNTHDLCNLCKTFGVETEKRDRLITFITACGNRAEVLQALLPLGDSAALQQLRALCDMLSDSPYKNHIRLDFSVVNNMNYYNGFVFRGFLEGVNSSVLAGGRYDKMMERMHRRAGAIGFAVYLDLLEQLHTPKDEYDIDVLVLYDDTVSPQSVLNAVRRFTNEGLSVSAQKCIPERPRCSSVIDLRKEHPTC